jgi:hypothetical protein
MSGSALRADAAEVVRFDGRTVPERGWYECADGVYRAYDGIHATHRAIIWLPPEDRTAEQFGCMWRWLEYDAPVPRLRLA